MEYLSISVNMFITSLKISDQAKGDFFQLNLPRIHEKRGYSGAVLTSAVFGNR